MNEPSSPESPVLAQPPRRAVTWRSVSLGTLFVVVVCAITPFNDYVINNGFFTGSYLPAALVLGLVLLVGGNTVANGLVPRRALSTGEMAVVAAMLLVGCAVPGQGMMRNVLPLPVAFFQLGKGLEPMWRAFSALGLPDWLWAVPDPANGRQSDVVTYFYGRLPDGEPIPWRAWLRPVAAWGAFVGCTWVALLALATLVRQQWVVNERLPFPLAQLGSMLIEPPATGRRVNRLLSDRAFWIATTGVFLLHAYVAMHRYQPAYFQDLSFTFDLSKILSEPPWVHLMGEVKRSTLYFTFVGITYFIQSRVGFSLWAIFVVEAFVGMTINQTGGDMPTGAWEDQHLGACVAFLAGTMWVGRSHWMMVARHVVGRRNTETEPVNYAGRAWVFIVAVAGMFVWLRLAGCGPLMAVAFVFIVVAAHLLVTRIVAETGLPFIRVMATIPQVITNFSPSNFTSRDVFFAGLSSYFSGVSSRESVMPHAMHGMVIAGNAEDRGSRIEDREEANAAPLRSSILHPRSSSFSFLAALGWALLIGFVVSAAASLWCYYNYALPLNKNASVMENNWGAYELPRQYVGNGIVDHATGRFPPKAHNAALHMATGATVTGVLQYCALRFSGWPFMPVAYLVSHTWYIRAAWWSIFIGWLAKVLILRFGGASLYQQLRPIFVGLIVGEALAAGFWLMVAMARVSMGLEYEVVLFAPQ